MTEQETLCMLALTRVPALNPAALRLLVGEMGSATAVFEGRKQLREVLPTAGKHTLEALALMDSHMERAKQELEFCRRNNIRLLGLHDESYPQRLRDCPDAPVLLYYMGTADLNVRHVVSIVGTRQITPYGKDLCHSFVRDLHGLCPDVLIVSGLAYGVDIHSHRAALEEGLDTVGVLAHGLNQIYPPHHRDTATRMLSQGGLLTEYMSGTAIDKRNFVQRNRIVAGMADAVVVVESAEKGGSLITADIAQSYNRPVWAFPGRIFDTHSSGCNRLIGTNRASLLTGAEDFCRTMGWADDMQHRQMLSQGVQQEFLADFTDEERRVLQLLSQADEKQANILSVEADIPMNRLTSLLFTLEMKGAVQMLAGGKYRIRH